MSWVQTSAPPFIGHDPLVWTEILHSLYPTPCPGCLCIVIFGIFMAWHWNAFLGLTFKLARGEGTVSCAQPPSLSVSPQMTASKPVDVFSSCGFFSSPMVCLYCRVWITLLTWHHLPASIHREVVIHVSHSLQGFQSLCHFSFFLCGCCNYR